MADIRVPDDAATQQDFISIQRKAGVPPEERSRELIQSVIGLFTFNKTLENKTMPLRKPLGAFWLSSNGDQITTSTEN